VARAVDESDWTGEMPHCIPYAPGSPTATVLLLLRTDISRRLQHDGTKARCNGNADHTSMYSTVHTCVRFMHDVWALTIMIVVWVWAFAASANVALEKKKDTILENLKPLAAKRKRPQPQISYTLPFSFFVSSSSICTVSPQPHLGFPPSLLQSATTR